MIENIYLVKFYDKDTDEVLGGLLITLNGGERLVVCGCCGTIFDPDDESDGIEILKIYDDWTDFSDTIKSGN